LAREYIQTAPGVFTPVADTQGTVLVDFVTEDISALWSLTNPAQITGWSAAPSASNIVAKRRGNLVYCAFDLKAAVELTDTGSDFNGGDYEFTVSPAFVPDAPLLMATTQASHYATLAGSSQPIPNVCWVNVRRWVFRVPVGAAIPAGTRLSVMGSFYLT
jgi:hypothetical protein